MSSAPVQSGCKPAKDSRRTFRTSLLVQVTCRKDAGAQCGRAGTAELIISQQRVEANAGFGSGRGGCRSRWSAARCSWPFSAVAADLCILNMPWTGGLAVTLSWQLGVGSICPPAPAGPSLMLPTSPKCPRGCRLGVPRAAGTWRRVKVTRPREVIESCHEVTPALVSSCLSELGFPQARQPGSCPGSLGRARGAPESRLVNGARPGEQSRILHFQWLVHVRP